MHAVDGPEHTPLHFVVTISSERLIPGRRTADDALTGLEASLYECGHEVVPAHAETLDRHGVAARNGSTVPVNT